MEQRKRPQQVLELRQFMESFGAPVPHFDEFAALFQNRVLDKGECFVRAGETPDSLAFVHSGIARMFYSRHDGKEFNKSFVTHPDFLSALEALITSSPSRLTIQALTPMQLFVARYSSVAGFFERDMFWQRAGRLIIEQVYVKKARREASLLMKPAAERYHDFLEEYRPVADQVPDYHIAAYLGITPQALSRLKHAARKKTRVSLPR